MHTHISLPHHYFPLLLAHGQLVLETNSEITTILECNG